MAGPDCGAPGLHVRGSGPPLPRRQGGPGLHLRHPALADWPVHNPQHAAVPALFTAGYSVLVALDSHSLLEALAKHPLLTEEVLEDEFWAAFVTVARRGCTVILQFFYSRLVFLPWTR